MAFIPKSDEEQAQMITRLVDGRLSASERADVEEWARQEPDVARAVARERRVAAGLRSAGPQPPERLIESVRARRETRRARASAADGARPPGWARAPRWRPAIGLAGLAAAGALALGLALSVGGGGARPSVSAAARLAFAPSTGSAPGVRDARYLDAAYGGVTYPNYVGQFGAVPTGERSDRIGGRRALTVFYRLSDGSRLSYTVFSGRPVALPANTRTVVAYGVAMHVFSTSGLSVVTLVRSGRTCVLAAPTSSRAVVALATAPLRV